MAHHHPPSHHHPHAHDHDRGHDRFAGARAARRDAARRALWVALLLTASYAAIEALGGLWAGSLALVSDAGHMLTDAGALGVALFAQYVARQPPSARASYGYARAEVLAAFVNALVMLALVIWIAVEAVRRLLAPEPVAGDIVIAVALVGLLVNLLAAAILSRVSDNLNSRGAMLHVLGDMLGSVAAIASGVIVRFTGWTPIDPILSLVVVLLILRSTWILLRESTQVLMEGVPGHLSYAEIGQTLSRLSGVKAVHDLHVWQMGGDRVALSAHVIINDAGDWLNVLTAAQRILYERFGIDHVTLQPAWTPPPPSQRIIPLTPVTEDRKPSLH